MVFNILNGDALAYSFPDAKIEGAIIVVRETLIDGDLSEITFITSGKSQIHENNTNRIQSFRCKRI
jgi:hypothetical protein